MCVCECVCVCVCFSLPLSVPPTCRNKRETNTTRVKPRDRESERKTTQTRKKKKQKETESSKERQTKQNRSLLQRVFFLCLQVLSYQQLTAALNVPNIRALEDIIIEAIYKGQIGGKLDQQLQQVSLSLSPSSSV